MPFDLALARTDTPGCLDKVFLDSAGSSLPPTAVVDTVVAHLRREATVGGYRAANERLSDLIDVKVALAQLIGTDASTIALSDSATRSWCDYFHSIPLQSGDRILISEAEYASNAIAALHRARQHGATVEVVGSDATGRIDLSALEHLLDERVRVVSLVHVPTNGGLVNPVREVCDLAHRVGARVLLDACQSIGQLPIDVTDLGVDALSATGRKWLRGPRGTGFLYIRPDPDLEPAVLDLHSAEWSRPDGFTVKTDASRFELWEHDVAARLGLGAAVRYLLHIGQDVVRTEIAARADYLRTTLTTVPRMRVHDLGIEHSGIVSFTVDGVDPIDVRDRLAHDDVTVTVSHRSSTLLDMTQRGLAAVVRASPHYFVSYDDLDRFTAALTAI